MDTKFGERKCDSIAFVNFVNRAKGQSERGECSVAVKEILYLKPKSEIQIRAIHL